MATMLETLAAQLGGASVQNLARTIGADQATTQKALGAALPFLVSALAKNAATPQGAEALHQAKMGGKPAQRAAGQAEGAGNGLLTGGCTNGDLRFHQGLG
jgi:hypothetical protein